MACLQEALAKYPALRQLGWRARRRIADARMELGIAYFKEGDYRRGVKTICRSVGGDPRQAADLVKLAWRWPPRRILGCRGHAEVNG